MCRDTANLILFLLRSSNDFGIGSGGSKIVVDALHRSGIFDMAKKLLAGGTNSATPPSQGGSGSGVLGDFSGSHGSSSDKSGASNARRRSGRHKAGDAQLTDHEVNTMERAKPLLLC